MSKNWKDKKIYLKILKVTHKCMTCIDSQYCKIRFCVSKETSNSLHHDVTYNDVTAAYLVFVPFHGLVYPIISIATVVSFKVDLKKCRLINLT